MQRLWNWIQIKMVLEISIFAKESVISIMQGADGSPGVLHDIWQELKTYMLPENKPIMAQLKDWSVMLT